MTRINFTEIAPAGMKALGGVYSYIAQSGLSQELIELIFLRVSEVNGCAYCIDMHTKALHKQGLLWDKIVLTRVWREAGNWFNSREKAALAWAESLTLISQTQAPDEVYAMVKTEFTEKEITDMTIAIGLMNAYNRLAISHRKLPDSAPR